MRAHPEDTAPYESHPSRDQSDIEVPGPMQRAWLRQLRWDFDQVNYTYLNTLLSRPTFELTRSRTRFGEWSGPQRKISISMHHILTHSWQEVRETLKHEMAHQYVDEHMQLGNAAPHGNAFREACRLLRCDDAATAHGANMEQLEDSNAERDKMLARIRELLALAGSPNEHEAANAMRMAQKYLLKYNLDLDELDAKRNYERRYLGQCAQRVQEYEYCLANILNDYFFVEVIWDFSYDPLKDRQGKILEIFGTPENLDIAEYVWNFVMGLTEPLWRERKAEIRRTGQRGTKLQYLSGLLNGLRAKLREQKRVLADEHGLVWSGDSKLAEFYRYQNPRIRRTSGGGVSRSNQYDAGFADGKKINIRRGVEGGATKRGRLLEGPR